MALGTLSFACRARGVVADDAANVVRLRGEVEWIATGKPDEVAALAHAVGLGHADQISEGALILRFGNSVGRFVVGELGSLVVQCGKWDDDTFSSLLSDLTEVALSLPFAADQTAGLAHDRSFAADDVILMHAFVYARYLLLESGESRLSRTMAAIFADPDRRFLVERRRVTLGDARRLDVRSFARLATGEDGVTKAAAAAQRLALAKSLRGHVPTHVDVPDARHSVDTAENRFVRGFLDQLDETVERVDSLARSRRAVGPFWARVQLDCQDMRKNLRPLRDHGLWADVGRLSHVPIASSVLQRRRGYRDVLRHSLLLRAASRLPANDALARLLGMKDVAALYELWSFFAVVRAIANVIGHAPDVAERPRVDAVQIDVPWGLRVRWREGIAVFYNLTFSQAHSDARRSTSLQLRPDVVIQVGSGTDCALHVLDAKLRIDRGSADETDASRSFKWSDIAKMHAYRDALPAVRTAFVLYPGDEAMEFTIDGGAGGARGAVGAIPLIPGTGFAHLIAHVQTVVGVGGSGNRLAEEDS